MAEFPLLRGEPIIDPNTGLLTLRSAEYFESLTSSVNETIISTEDAEGFFAEIQQLQALSGVFNKTVAELDRAMDQLGRAEALIAKLTKQIKELEALASDY